MTAELVQAAVLGQDRREDATELRGWASGLEREQVTAVPPEATKKVKSLRWLVLLRQVIASGRCFQRSNEMACAVLDTLCLGERADAWTRNPFGGRIIRSTGRNTRWRMFAGVIDQAENENSEVLCT